MNSLSVHATASLCTAELNMLGCPDNSKMYKDQVTKCLVLEFIHSMPAVPPNCVQYGTSGVVGVTTHLIKVVHEHLPHLVDRYGCIHRAL